MIDPTTSITARPASAVASTSAPRAGFGDVLSRHLDAPAPPAATPVEEEREGPVPQRPVHPHISDAAARRQQIAAGLAEQRLSTDRTPDQLTRELIAATEEGRTVRISQSEYEALLAHNHATLGGMRAGWSQDLGLAPGDLARGGYSRTVAYGSIIGQSRPVPGYEQLHGLAEVPPHLQGPNGGPLTVFRPTPTFWNTGGGRYLPPEVSNSPNHHDSRRPGAIPGPSLPDRPVSSGSA